MKQASAILLTASGAAVLAAVWAPGAWWQWGLTALVLLLAGAGTGGGTSAKREALHELAQAEQEAAEVEDRSRASFRKIEAAAEAERSRLGLQPRPTYGKKAGDQ